MLEEAVVSKVKSMDSKSKFKVGDLPCANSGNSESLICLFPYFHLVTILPASKGCKALNVQCHHYFLQLLFVYRCASNYSL